MDRRRLKSLAASLLALFPALHAGATIDATLQMQLGNPTGATSDSNNYSHYLIQRSVEAIDFDDLLGVPNWASWDLTGSDVGDSGRVGSFEPDPSLPSNFYAVTTSDYDGASTVTSTNAGYDRGHMCPSGDRTDNATDNDLVFYMTNVLPQASANNEDIWENLEDYCRTLATAGSELLITCGGQGYTNVEIPSGKAYVPSNLWKIAVVVPGGGGTALSRITTSTRVIAVYMPNTAATGTDPWTKYTTSVNQIQSATGDTFFTALPASVAAVLRAKVDGAPAPVLASFAPASGGAGSSVVLTGSAFTSTSTVAFNGTNAAFTVNSDTQITAVVPSGASTGAISLIAPGGLATSATNFTVTGSIGPTITSFAPASGVVGSSVVLTGSGFISPLTVAFNGISASTVLDSTTQITATVPAGATTGPITLTTNGGSTTSASSFTVITSPTISGFLPVSGTAGTSVLVSGSGFSSASSVTFNGAAAGFTVNSDAQITATVPSGAVTGPISVVNPAGTTASSGTFTVTNGSAGIGEVVISQIYGGGGNAGSYYTNDYIELYNLGTASVDLSTYAVQYASASGSSWLVTNLSGTIAPGHYYLIQEASGTTGTSNLPTPQVIGSTNMSASNGKVALTSNHTTLTGASPSSGAIVDFVGYGTANAYLGSPAPGLSNTTAGVRADGGGQDTNNNLADFTASTPNPRNSSLTEMDTWRALTFSSAELSNALISGTLANPSGDGWTNLAKYAFNLNPHLPDGSTAITTSMQASGNSRTLTLTHRRNHYAADITFTYQTSTDLATWTTNGVSAPVVAPLDSMTDSVSVSVTSTGTEVFLRVVVGH